MGPHPDRTPAASPAGVQPYPCCEHCPPEDANGHRHTDGRDITGHLFPCPACARELTEDEEPERGGATSAWEHHHA